MLSYIRTGPTTDLPLVLLHALPLDSTMWDQVRELLPDRDIITVDAPGFGKSPRGEEFAEGDPAISTYVEALKARLDDLGVTRMGLAGLSMGGSVAAQFTAAYPQMVAGLALIDTNITADDPDRQAFRRNMAERADAGEGYSAVENWTTIMVGSECTDEVRASLDARFKVLRNDGLAWIQRALADRPDSSAAVGMIDGPVFFVRGMDDPTASLESYQELGARCRNPYYVEIPGAGHFTADEKPAELARALDVFAHATALYARG
ncbi:alpha/beta fold hydrolase [Trueperella sp. LYQ141]|uniref:alpha/beta fold hydrolase n=1 Tax=Trueperella sp. LYQ141 TaxID=3391058 RepID=UPI003983C2CB